jgi:hypothetical protein
MKVRLVLLAGLVLVAGFVVSGCCHIPPYSPVFWNDSGTVQYNNNCYNYGNNKRTDTFAQPGRQSGDYPNPMTCTEVGNAAVNDGVLRVPASGVCPGTEDKIALVVDPGTDYHWYRLGTDGMWTHKPGGTQATNLDASGNPITNPETADRCSGYLCYTDFCGYFCSCSSDVQGAGHENIQ